MHVKERHCKVRIFTKTRNRIKEKKIRWKKIRNTRKKYIVKENKAADSKTMTNNSPGLC